MWGLPKLVWGEKPLEPMRFSDDAETPAAVKSSTDIPASKRYSLGGHQEWSRLAISQSRQAAHETSYGCRFLKVLDQEVVGAMRTRLRLDDENLQRRWNRWWHMPTTCGWSGETLLHVLFRHLTVDGDAIVEWVRTPEGWLVQPIDPLLLGAAGSNPSMASDARLWGIGGHWVQNTYSEDTGIDVDDATGRPVQYRILDRDGEERAIPASEVIHVFQHLWIGQRRGLPCFSDVGIKALEQMDCLRSSVADDFRKRAALGLIFRIQRSLSDGLVRLFQRKNPDTDANEQALVDAWMRPGLNMKPGQNLQIPEGVELVEGRRGLSIPGTDYEITHRAFGQDAGANLGMQHATLVGDNSDGNFASQRLGRLADIGLYRMYQNLMYDVVALIYVEWVIREELAADSVRYRIMQPGFEAIDPTKTASAHKINLELGLTTREIIAAETLGLDWNTEIFPQWQREKELLGAMQKNETGTGSSPE